MSRVWQIFAELVTILQIHKLKTPSATLGSFANQIWSDLQALQKLVLQKIFL